MPGTATSWVASRRALGRRRGGGPPPCDQDKIRKRSPPRQPSTIAAPDGLSHRCRVVRPFPSPHVEGAVVALAHPPSLPDHERRHLSLPLEVRDVEALYPQGRPREAEHGRELLRHPLGLAPRGAGAQPERLTGVILRERQHPRTLPASGPEQFDGGAALLPQKTHQNIRLLRLERHLHVLRNRGVGLVELTEEGPEEGFVGWSVEALPVKFALVHELPVPVDQDSDRGVPTVPLYAHDVDRSRTSDLHVLATRELLECLQQVAIASGALELVALACTPHLRLEPGPRLLGG